MPHTIPQEEGVSEERQRIEIEQEFEHQRASLTAETVRFEEWDARWKARQEEIDEALSRLDRTLRRRFEPPQRLKILE